MTFTAIWIIQSGRMEPAGRLPGTREHTCEVYSLNRRHTYEAVYYHNAMPFPEQNGTSDRIAVLFFLCYDM